MTKLDTVAPKPDQLKVGMTLKITAVRFETKDFGDGDVKSALITSEGKTFWTTSKPVIGKLESSEVQEFLSNLVQGDALECEVKEGGDKSKKYMFLE